MIWTYARCNANGSLWIEICASSVVVIKFLMCMCASACHFILSRPLFASHSVCVPSFIISKFIHLELHIIFFHSIRLSVVQLLRMFVVCQIEYDVAILAKMKYSRMGKAHEPWLVFTLCAKLRGINNNHVERYVKRREYKLFFFTENKQIEKNWRKLCEFKVHWKRMRER